MRAGKRKADIGRVEALSQMIGRKLQFHAELLQHIRRSRAARRRAIAMLDDLHTRRSRDQRRRGGNIKRVPNVPARSAGIQNNAICLAPESRSLFPASPIAAPTNSSTVVPLAASPTSNPPISASAGVAGHDVQKCLPGLIASQILAGTALIGCPRTADMKQMISCPDTDQSTAPKSFDDARPTRRGRHQNIRLAIKFRSIASYANAGSAVPPTAAGSARRSIPQIRPPVIRAP